MCFARSIPLDRSHMFQGICLSRYPIVFVKTPRITRFADNISSTAEKMKWPSCAIYDLPRFWSSTWSPLIFREFWSWPALIELQGQARHVQVRTKFLVSCQAKTCAEIISNEIIDSSSSEPSAVKRLHFHPWDCRDLQAMRCFTPSLSLLFDIPRALIVNQKNWNRSRLFIASSAQSPCCDASHRDQDTEMLTSDEMWLPGSFLEHFRTNLAARRGISLNQDRDSFNLDCLFIVVDIVTK